MALPADKPRAPAKRSATPLAPAIDTCVRRRLIPQLSVATKPDRLAVMISDALYSEAIPNLPPANIKRDTSPSRKHMAAWGDSILALEALAPETASCSCPPACNSRSQDRTEFGGGIRGERKFFALFRDMINGAATTMAACRQCLYRMPQIDSIEGCRRPRSPSAVPVRVNGDRWRGRACFLARWLARVMKSAQIADYLRRHEL